MAKSWKAYLSEFEQKKGAPLNALDLTTAQREYTDYLKGLTRFQFADDEEKAKALSYVYGIPEDKLGDVDFEDETKLLKHTFRNYYTMKGIKPGEENPLAFFDEKGNEDPRSPGFVKFDPVAKSIVGWGEEDEKTNKPRVDIYFDSEGRARIARSTNKLDPDTEKHYQDLIDAQLNKPVDKEEHGWTDVVTKDIPSMITDYAPLYGGGAAAMLGRQIGSEGLEDLGEGLARRAEVRLAGKPQTIDPAKIASDLGKQPGDIMGIADLVQWGLSHPKEAGDDVIGELVKQGPFIAAQAGIQWVGERLGGAVGARVGALAGGLGALPGAAIGSRIGGAAAAVAGAYGEGLVEGNETYDTVLAMTGDEEKALKAANDVVGKNVLLNTALNYLSFSGIGKTGPSKSIFGAIGKSLVRSGAYADDVIKNSTRFQRMMAKVVENEKYVEKLGARGAKVSARLPFELAGMGAVVVEQGGQEWAQFGFQEQAKGNTFWTPSTERNIETVIGGLGGGATDVVVRSRNLWDVSQSIDQKLAGIRAKAESASNSQEAAYWGRQYAELKEFQNFTPTLIDDWAQTAIASGADPEQISMVLDESRNGITQRAMNMANAISKNIDQTWDLADKSAPGTVPEPLVDNLINSLRAVEDGSLGIPGGNRRQSLENVHKFVNKYYANWATEDEQTQFAQDVWQRVFGEEIDETKAWTPEVKAAKEQRFTEQIVEAEEKRLKSLPPTEQKIEAVVNKHDLDYQTAGWLVQFGEHLRNGTPPMDAFVAATEANQGVPPNLTKPQALTLGLTEEVAVQVETAKKAFDEQQAKEFANSPEMIGEKIKVYQNMLLNPNISKKDKKKLLSDVRQLKNAQKTAEKRISVGEKKKAAEAQRAAQMEQQAVAAEEKRVKDEAARAEKARKIVSDEVAKFNAENDERSAEIDALVAAGMNRTDAIMRVLGNEGLNASRVREATGQVRGRGAVAKGSAVQGGTNLEQPTQGQPSGAEALAQTLATIRGDAGRIVGTPPVAVVTPEAVPVVEATPVAVVTPDVAPAAEEPSVTPAPDNLTNNPTAIGERISIYQNLLKDPGVSKKEKKNILSEIRKLSKMRAEALKNAPEVKPEKPPKRVRKASAPEAPAPVAPTEVAPPAPPTAPPVEPTQPQVAPETPPTPPTPTPAQPPVRRAPRSNKARNKAMSEGRKSGGKNPAEALRGKEPILKPGATIEVYDDDGVKTEHKVTTVRETPQGLTEVRVDDGKDGEVTLTPAAENETNMLVRETKAEEPPKREVSDEEAAAMVEKFREEEKTKGRTISDEEAAEMVAKFREKEKQGAPPPKETAEARHERVTRGLQERADQITERLKTEQNETVIENLSKELALLNDIISAKPRDVRPVGTGLAAEAKRLAGETRGATAAEGAGGEESIVEKAAIDPDAADELLTRAQIKAKRKREKLTPGQKQLKLNEAMQQRIGFEEMERDQAKRLGNVLHASGTGKGATVDQEDVYKSVHNGEEVMLTKPSAKPRKEEPGRSADQVYFDEYGGLFMVTDRGEKKDIYILGDKGEPVKKTIKAKYFSQYKKALPMDQELLNELKRSLQTDMSSVLSSIENDTELLEKHNIELRHFEDRTIAHGDPGNAFNFWKEARDKYASPEQSKVINGIMANLYEKYMVMLGEDVNTPEYEAELQAVKDGTLPDDLEPFVYEQGPEISDAAKADVLELLRERGPKIATRIRSIVAAEGFKDVKEINISAWMGFKGKVRLAIQAAQKRADGSWGPISVNENVSTTDELRNLQRVTEQRIAAAVLEEVGMAGGGGVVIDSFGFVGAPPNWKAKAEVAGGRFFPSENVTVPDAVDAKYHFIEPVYNTNRSSLQSQLDKIAEEIKKTYKTVRYSKKVDRQAYDRIEKKKKQSAKLRESGKDKLADKIDAQIASLEESVKRPARITDEQKQAVAHEQYLKVQPKLRELAAQREELKKKLAAERKRLGLPDFESRSWTGRAQQPSTVSDEEWARDTDVEYKPLTIRERADQRYNLIRQAGMGAMDDTEFQRYTTDDEYRQRVDAMWEARALEIERSLKEKEKLHALDQAIAREVFSENVDTPKGSTVVTRAQKRILSENIGIANMVVNKFKTGDKDTDEELRQVAIMGMLEAVMRLNNNESLVKQERKYDAAKTEEEKARIAKKIAEIRESNVRGEINVNLEYLKRAARVAVLNHLTKSEPMTMSNVNPNEKGYTYRSDEARFASKAWEFVRDYRKLNQNAFPTEEYLVNKLRNYVEDGKRQYVRFDTPDLEARVADFLTNIATTDMDNLLKDEDGESTGGRVIGAIRDEYTGRGEGPQYYQLLSKEIRQLVARKFGALTEREQLVLGELFQLRKVETNKGPKFVPAEFAGEEAAPELAEVADRVGVSVEEAARLQESGLNKLRKEPELQHLRPISRQKAKPVQTRTQRIYVDPEVMAHLNKMFPGGLGVEVSDVGGVQFLVGEVVDLDALLNPSNFMNAREAVREMATQNRSAIVIKPQDVAKGQFTFNDANGEEVGIGDLVLVRKGKGQFTLNYVSDVMRRPGGFKVELTHYSSGEKSFATEDQLEEGGTKAAVLLTPENLSREGIGKASRLKYMKIYEADQRRRDKGKIGSVGLRPAKGRISNIPKQGTLTSREIELLKEARWGIYTRRAERRKGIAPRSLGGSNVTILTREEGRKQAYLEDAHLKMLDEIERASGKSVVLVDDPTTDNYGYFQIDNPDVLFVNVGSMTRNGMNRTEFGNEVVKVAIHEYVHSITYGLDPGEQNDLFAALGFDTLNQEYSKYVLMWAMAWRKDEYNRYKEVMDDINRIHSNGGILTKTDLERLAIHEYLVVGEFMAHVVQDRYLASGFLNHVRENNPKLMDSVIATLQKFVDAAIKMLNTVVSKAFPSTTGWTLKKLQADVNEFEKWLDRYARLESKKTASRMEMLTNKNASPIESRVASAGPTQDLSQMSHEELVELGRQLQRESIELERNARNSPEDRAKYKDNQAQIAELIFKHGISPNEITGPSVVGSAPPPQQNAVEMQDFMNSVGANDPVYWMRQARAIRENQIVTDANKVPGMLTNNSAPTAVATPGINDNKILGQFPGLVKTLAAIAPTAFSRQAKQAATSLRSELGHAERRRAQAAEILRGASAYIDEQLAKKGDNWSLDVIDKIENNKIGEIQDATTRQIAEALRQLLDARAEMITAIDPEFIGELAELDPGYFPHMFKMSSGRTAAAGRRAATFEGGRGFTHRRIYETLKEGIADGLEPVSYNFVDVVTMRLANEDRFIAAHRYMKSAVDNGRAMWVTTQGEKTAKREREKDFATKAAEMRSRVGRSLTGVEKAALRREYTPIAQSGVPDDWVQIDDPIARVPGDRTKVLYMPPDAANILENYLKRSTLQDVPAFQAYRNMSNFMNQLQLGYSFFHLMFTSIDAAANQLSVGLKYLALGLSRGNFKDLRRAAFNIVTSPIAGLTNLAAGQDIRREYKTRGIKGGRAIKNTGEHPFRDMRRATVSAASWVGRGPAGLVSKLLGLDQSETGVKLDDKAFNVIIDAIERAGGAVEMDDFYRTGARARLRQATVRGERGKQAWNALPGITEMISSVILEGVVPAQKLGAFYQLARFEIDRLGPDAEPEVLDAALQKAWDSVDNRMGQLVYNNLFWNKTFKDILMASFRAVGWTFGSLREGVGAFMDVGKLVSKPFRGEKVDFANDFSHRMSYAIAMPIMVMTMGAILGKGLGQGDDDDDEKSAIFNYLYPKTGNVDAYGEPERVQLASYMKDVFAWSDKPFQTFFHKLHPAILTASNMVAGHDYLGNKITEPDDNIVEKGWKNLLYAAKEYMPFSFRNMQRHIEQTGDDSLNAYIKGFGLPFFGIVPAPASAGRSDAENLAREYTSSSAKFLKDERAQARMKAKAQLRMKLAKGQTKFTNEELGPVGRSEIGRIRKEARKEPILRAISSVQAHNIMDIWDEMTDKEKKIARRAVITKLVNALKTTSDMDEKSTYREYIERIREETRGGE